MIEDSTLIAALRDSNAVTEEDLERGRQLSNESGRPLYHILIDNELADEIATVRIAAELLNVPFVELSDLQPTPEVLARIPATLAFRNRVFPLKVEEKDGQAQLFLAMADPIDVLAMDEVATHTGVDIRPVLAGPRDLKHALEQAYPRDADGSEALEDVEPFSADFDLDEISSFDHDSSLDEDSWEAFFDEAEDAEEDEELEDSMVLSREMRDRRTSQELEHLEDIDGSEAADADGDEALQSLEEPLSQSQMTGGVETDLSDWEIDERLEGAEQTQEEKDYAAIGSFFVYSSEDARKKRLQDLADFEDRESSGHEAAPRKDPSRADTSDSDLSVPSRETESDNLEEISGVTSMSKAPFMFDESDAAPEPAPVENDEDGEGDEDDVADEDSGGHTMVGRGLGLAPESSEDELDDDDRDELADDEDQADDDGDGETSMVGGPFGMIGDDDEDAEYDDQDADEGDLEEDSDGSHTMVGSTHGRQQSEAEIVDGEIEVLDEDEFEIIDEPEPEDEEFGSQTQFGVVPQGESAPADKEFPSDEATDEEIDAMGGESQAPLAQQIAPGNKKKDTSDDEDAEESTKSRLSGLLSKVRGKKSRQKTQTSENQAADPDQRPAEAQSTAGQSADTEEQPVAKASQTTADDDVTDDDQEDTRDNVRETQPNRTVTALRAQAMQEEAGLAAVFAKHVAEITALDDRDAAALSELSAEELMYVTMLALFDKGVLAPRDILDQFDDDE